MDPDVILISDDDEPITPVKILRIGPKTAEKIQQKPSTPRTPGRLSLSYGKIRTPTEMKTGEGTLTITPIAKEIKSSEVVLLPVVTSKGTPVKSTSLDGDLKNAKLQSIIEKIKRKEIQQNKSKTNLMLPVPVGGPLEPYQCPENDNEVHSSTGSDEMKNNAITRMFDNCREFARDKDDLKIVERMWTKEFYDEMARLPHSNESALSSLGGPEAGPSTSRSPSEGHEPDTTSVETRNEKCKQKQDTDTTSIEMRNEMRIQKLEKTLMRCSKKIRELEEKEMSLDDLDDDMSTYLEIDCYKKKSLQIWKKLCMLNGQTKALCERVTEQKFVYEGSRYPEINKCVSRLVNRHKTFPDFCDIIDLITQCNSQFDLHLRPFQIDMLAREAFKDIGKELKLRRIIDYEEHFGCPVLNVNEIDNDPASQDEVLNAKLAESKKLGCKKADEIFELFVKKQVELNLQPQNTDVSESHNEDESEEDDTEKEVPTDGAFAESESESDKEIYAEKADIESVEEEEVEYEIEEQQVGYSTEEEKVEYDIKELLDKGKYDIQKEKFKDAFTKNGNFKELALESVTLTSEIETFEMQGVNAAGSSNCYNQPTNKRRLTPELSIHQPSKRHTAINGKNVEVRSSHDLKDFSEPNRPYLNKEANRDVEVVIIE